MKKISKKTVKRKRTDHAAACRVDNEELAIVQADIEQIRQTAGIPITLGAYTKLAILSHARLRRLERGIKELVRSANDRFREADAPPPIVEELEKLIEAAP